MSKETQNIVDHMVRGYVDMLTPYEPEVISSGEVRMEGTHCSIIIDAATHEEDFIIKIIDHFDPHHPIEEAPQGLGSVVERLNEIYEQDNDRSIA